MRLILGSLLAGFLLVVRGGGIAHAQPCPAPAHPVDTGHFDGDVGAHGVSCKEAAKVVLKHYKCRTEKAQTGFCVHRIAGGYGCREQRTSISDQYFSHISCTAGDGKKKVKFNYTQYY
jgi:hypothetical protein